MTRRAIRTTIVAAGLALGAAHPALAQVSSGINPYGRGTFAISPYGAATPAQPGIRAATPPLGGPAVPLGTVQFSLGSLAPPLSGTLGTIAPCSTRPAVTAPIDAANGVLPPLSVGTAYGTLSMAGACNPILPGAAPAATAPTDPNAAANFANGAFPLSSTETSSGGLSPQVAVPTPSIPPSPGSVPLNTGLQTSSGFLFSGPASALVPVFPIPAPSSSPPAISSSGCAGDPSCGGVP